MSGKYYIKDILSSIAFDIFVEVEQLEHIISKFDRILASPYQDSISPSPMVRVAVAGGSGRAYGGHRWQPGRKS